MAAPGLACADKRTGNTQLIDNRSLRGLGLFNVAIVRRLYWKVLLGLIKLIGLIGLIGLVGLMKLLGLLSLISFISLVSLTTRIRTTVQHLDKKRCSLEASGLTLMTTLAQEESFFRK